MSQGNNQLQKQSLVPTISLQLHESSKLNSLPTTTTNHHLQSQSVQSQAASIINHGDIRRETAPSSTATTPATTPAIQANQVSSIKQTPSAVGPTIPSLAEGSANLWAFPMNIAHNFEGLDKLARDASEMSDVSDDSDDHDNIDPATPTTISKSHEKTASSSALAAIQPQYGMLIAGSDLKAAAGYQPYGSYFGSPSYSPAASGGYYGGHPSGHHDYHHGKYYQYASVPAPHTWKFGYRRGNPYHTIERHEYGYGPHFKTKVKWADKHGGYGVQIYDYNHSDKHHDNYHGHHHYGASKHFDDYSANKHHAPLSSPKHYY